MPGELLCDHHVTKASREVVGFDSEYRV